MLMEKHPLLPSLLPPSTQDVYLQYKKEHYDSIVEVKPHQECNQILTFNITAEDIAAFAKIGASFHITNPAENNGGKLYFVPPKDFCTNSNDPVVGDGVKSSNTTDCTERNCVKETVSDDDGTLFVPNAETLKNGVIDFGEDIETQQTQYSDDKTWSNIQNEMYDMFGDMGISNEIPTKY